MAGGAPPTGCRRPQRSGCETGEREQGKKKASCVLKSKQNNVKAQQVHVKAQQVYFLWLGRALVLELTIKSPIKVEAMSQKQSI